MRRSLVTVILFVMLITLSAIQMMLDYQDELRMNESLHDVSKQTDYVIFIEIEDKTLYLLQDGRCIKKYPIASGKPGWPSPIGYWKIISKGDWGEGFGGRWLGLNVPWGTVHLE